MRSRVLVGLVVSAFVLACSPAAAGEAPVTVTVDRTTVATRLGQTFVIHSTITNRSSAVARGLIAHLNVLSLGPGLYVDPEDWSSHRTRYLAPLSPGGSITLRWPLAAVNAGDLGVYIAVVPQSGPGDTPVTGPLVRATIADRRTLDPGGILPLALGVPAALALAMVVVRLRRR